MNFFRSIALFIVISSITPLSAEVGVTMPTGYVKHYLKNGQFNVIGLTLHEAPKAAGEFDVVSGTILTDNDTNFTTALTSGATYILEITSAATPALDGAIQEITSWSGNTITTSLDLVAEGLTTSDKYTLRKAPTLEELFGTTNSVLKKGVVSNIADIVWIPDGAGSYTRYYLSTTNQWKNAGTNALAPQTAVIYTDGMYIERKGPDTTLIVVGSVKTAKTSLVLGTGFNLISAIYPEGSTLQNSGLSDSLKAGVVSNIADIVWVPDGTGNYTRYFYSTTGQWKNAATNAVVNSAVELPSGVSIERKGGATNAKIQPPSSYSDL